MGTIKTNGIIIQESNMGDYDKMLTMLTPRVTGKLAVLQRAQEDQKVHSLQAVSFCVLEIIYFMKEQIHTILIRVKQ